MKILLWNIWRFTTTKNISNPIVVYLLVMSTRSFNPPVELSSMRNSSNARFVTNITSIAYWVGWCNNFITSTRIGIWLMQRTLAWSKDSKAYINAIWNSCSWWLTQISFSRENVGGTKSTPSSHTQMDCIMPIIHSKDSTKIKAESDASNFVYRNLQVWLIELVLSLDRT